MVAAGGQPIAATTASPPRIATLDIVRGVGVMGILAMNIVGFAMPPQAYLNPLAYGSDTALDMASFAFSFVLIDGKMRGLFSFLFGASMLLVAQRTEAKGGSAASVIFRRQLWLLVFGMLHYYLIWYGDILIGYALIGMAAWLFRRLPAEKLVGWGMALVMLQLFVMISLAASAHSLAAEVASGNADASALSAWQDLSRDAAVPGAKLLNEELALFLGPWPALAHHQLTAEWWVPYFYTLFFGWETLAYMLFGMAALKSGFLTGAWDDRLYEKIAVVGFAVTIPAYAVLALLLFADGFSVPGLFTWSFAATVPVRPAMVAAMAALIILLTRDGGALVDRIAAAGRAAFTNYLGTSILMTALFYGWGLGLFGTMGRAELWLVVLAMWMLMLAWSKPWLDLFTYGPFEWLWRSLARGRMQRMRKHSSLPTQSAGRGTAQRS